MFKYRLKYWLSLIVGETENVSKEMKIKSWLGKKRGWYVYISLLLKVYSRNIMLVFFSSKISFRL